MYTASLTLFSQLVAQDSWSQFFLPLAEEAPWTALLFIILMTVSLGVMNLILAARHGRATSCVLFTYLLTYLLTHLSIYPSIHLSIHLSIYLSTYWRLSGNKGIQKNMPHGKFQVLDVVDMFMMQNYHNDTDN